MSIKERTTKFELGQVIVTPTASAALEASGQSTDDVLARHQSGDWGDVSDSERQVNERGLESRFNLLSIYRMARGDKVSVVTNADRSLTLVHIDPRP